MWSRFNENNLDTIYWYRGAAEHLDVLREHGLFDCGLLDNLDFPFPPFPGLSDPEAPASGISAALSSWETRVRRAATSRKTAYPLLWTPSAGETGEQRIRDHFRTRLVDLGDGAPEEVLHLFHLSKWNFGIVYHVACMGNWREVAAMQLASLRAAGLDGVLTSLLGSDGDREEFERMAADAGVEISIRYHGHDLEMFEIPALGIVEDWASARPEGYVMYLHTKGVSAPEDALRQLWLRFMQKEVVERGRENCTLLRDGYDAVGATWTTCPFKHFPGNFFMAKASYVRSLGNFSDFYLNPRHEKNGYFHRIGAEFWIGSSKLDSRWFAPVLSELPVTSMEFWTENKEVIANRNPELSRDLDQLVWKRTTSLINHLIRMTGACSYLEIGEEKGRKLEDIHCPYKLYVREDYDGWKLPDARSGSSSDRFFSDNGEHFDLVFVNGHHEASQVHRDLSHALDALPGRGIVICQNINPRDEAMQMVPRTQALWTGDCWKAWIRLRAERPDLVMLAIEDDHGIGIILQNVRNEPIQKPETMKTLEWQEFDKQRKALLNMTSIPEVEEALVRWLREKPEIEASPRLADPMDFGAEPWTLRTRIINEIIRRKNASSYLEIGYGDGNNFHDIVCGRKWSVDPGNCDFPGVAPTHRMTSDAFFESNGEKFDVIFVDGLHHASQVERDLTNSLAALNPHGVVVCHDMNPANEESQMVPRVQDEWTGDCWKAWVRLRASRPSLAMVVVDADFGVGVILPDAAAAEEMKPVGKADPTWAEFSDKKREWLNLLPPEEARAFVLDRIRGGENAAAAPASPAPEWTDEAMHGAGHSPVEGPFAVILHGVVHENLGLVLENLDRFLLDNLRRSGEVDVFYHCHGNTTSGDSELKRRFPDAKGILDSPESIDRHINWELVFSRNAAEIGEGPGVAGVKSYRRDVESKRQAWDHFQKCRGKDYSGMVVMRLDLLFTADLPLPQGWGKPSSPDGHDGASNPRRLFVPRHDTRGGIFDGFAMGAETEIGIWSREAPFADGCLMKAADASAGNVEWLLVKWLQQNGVRMESIDCALRPVGNSDGHPVEVASISHAPDHGPLDGNDSWFEQHRDEWLHWFFCREPVRAMTVGTADGPCVRSLLRHVFTHSGSVVHCVNACDRSSPRREKIETEFAKHVAQGGLGNQVHLHNGAAGETLAGMIAGNGYWESFDFIYHDGGNSGDLLVAACQSWHLLKPGGLMAFKRAGGKRRLARRLALDTFVSAFGHRINLLTEGNLLIVRKL